MSEIETAIRGREKHIVESESEKTKATPKGLSPERRKRLLIAAGSLVTLLAGYFIY
jgi:hypothetical protein